MAAAAILAASTSTAYGWTTVTNTNGDTWNVNDALVPGLDTGSIHNTGTNSLQGYGGIRVKVPGTARLNGILLRGFGISPDTPTAFTTKQAVQIGGVAVKRTLTFNTAEAYARFLDTFTNTTSAPVTIEVAFGGQLGLQHGHQPERDRVHLVRRRRAHAGGQLGLVLLAVGGRRLGHGQRHQRDRHRHVRQAPATSCATRSASRCRRPATRATTSAS